VPWRGLTAEIGRRKNRIRALAQAMVPTINAALSQGLNHTDLAVLERYADPRALLAAGLARLRRLIATTSRGQLGAAKAQALRAAAAEAVALWDGDSAAALDDLAAEVASEVRLVRAAEAERARHEHARDAALGPRRPGRAGRANQTGQTDRKHQPMTKAGPRALRSQWSANSANTNRSCWHPKMSIRSSTSRRTVPTHRSA
jgi:hypothetical protein